MVFKNVGTSKRLGIGFGILGFLMVALVVTGITATSMINSRLEQIAQVNNAKIQAAYETKDGIKTVNLLALCKLLSKDEAFMAKADQIIMSMREQLRSTWNTGEARNIGEGEGASRSFQGKLRKGGSPLRQGASGCEGRKADEAVSIFVGTILPGALELFHMGDRIVEYQKDEIAARTAEAQKTFSRAMTFLIFMGVVISRHRRGAHLLTGKKPHCAHQGDCGSHGKACGREARHQHRGGTGRTSSAFRPRHSGPWWRSGGRS